MSRFFQFFKSFKNWLKLGIFGSLATALTIFGCNYWVQNQGAARLYDSIEEIPARKVGLVLGTSKKNYAGRINLYFKYRMEAAADLYKAGRIQRVLVSGDNHIESYDEATDMLEYLVALGVPEKHITLDYAGFRTLDSVVRAKEVFGQNEVTIISQKFHNERALFIADFRGVDAIGFNAKSVPAKYSGLTHKREYLARVKAVLDVIVLQKGPKFLGEPVEIALN